MRRKQDYRDKYTHHNRSVLPEPVQDACHDLGQAFRSNTVTQEGIDRFRLGFQGLSAEAVPRASDEIRGIARLYKSEAPDGSGNPGWFSGSFFSKPEDVPVPLDRHPDLGWLLLFHGNGFIRQAALEALCEAPQCPFEFSAIVYRLNDWVGNVRRAAADYSERTFGQTSASVVAESAFFLLHQAHALNRWDRVEKKQLDAVFQRPDVARLLKNEFLGIRPGRVGQTFRQFLQGAEIDPYLEELARDARLPSVRAIATQTLLSGRAQWFVGYREVWVDKRFGCSTKIAEFDSRAITPVCRESRVLEQAALDRSVQVRKVAADALIARRESATDRTDRIAHRLAADRNVSVRARAEFYLRKRAENSQIPTRDLT